MRLLTLNFVGDWINNWIKGMATDVLKFCINAAKFVLDQTSQELPLVKTWYGIFVAFAAVLVVVVALIRIVFNLLKEADESTDVTISNILLDSIKSGAAIPVMLFIQGFLQTEIIIPLAKAMFDMSGKFSADAISGTTKIYTKVGNPSGAITMGTGMTIAYLIFFTVVVAMFLIKMCIYYCNMGFYTLSVPATAVSIASENMDYSSTWWKKLIYYNVSMLSQVLSLTLCIYCFTNMIKLGFVGFIGSIGFGWLVLHTPHVIEDFWTSTGITKAAGRASLRSLTRYIRRKIGK